MVRGMEVFREHFADFADCYVLIGGAACDLLMEEAGLLFRVTKDLDIVLSLEFIDGSFVSSFWEFVRRGRYQLHQTSKGRRHYYRFTKPEGSDYPYMLELFSRKPDALELKGSSNLTPITVDEEVSSLSAILMDESYYSFLHLGRRVINNITVADSDHLIALKARAWLDLTRRKQAGQNIDSKSILKHKNDVFRLYQLLDPGSKRDYPQSIRNDVQTFLEALERESIDLKNLGIRRTDLKTVLSNLRKMYGLG